MTNLFEYATKELSQDAFLMWLISNYNYEDQEVRSASLSLLKELGLPSDLDSLEVEAQWHKVDIAVFLHANGEDFALLIEDKINSMEHDKQLERYESILHKNRPDISDKNIKRLYYKLGKITDEEAKACGSDWEQWDYRKIASFFSSFAGSDNLILKQYAEHTLRIYDEYSRTSIPSSQSSEIYSNAAWDGFFSNVLLPRLDSRFKVHIGKSNYDYTYMAIYRKDKLESGDKDKGIPYLEIRSRDLIKEEHGYYCRFLVLAYDVDYNKYKEQLDSLCAKIDIRGLSSKSRRKMEPKQLGVIEPPGYLTEDDVIRSFDEAVNRYFELMEDW